MLAAESMLAQRPEVDDDDDDEEEEEEDDDDLVAAGCAGRESASTSSASDRLGELVEAAVPAVVEAVVLRRKGLVEVPSENVRGVRRTESEASARQRLRWSERDKAATGGNGQAYGSKPRLQ